MTNLVPDPQRINNNDKGWLVRTILNGVHKLLGDAVNKLNNEKVDRKEITNLSVGIKDYKKDVTEITDLPKTGNVQGDARVVINDKDNNGRSFIWLWNGTSWSRTAFTSFPSDIAVTQDLRKINIKLEDSIQSASYAYKQFNVQFDSSILTIKDNYLNSNGEEVSQTGNCCSDFIAIPSNAVSIMCPLPGSSIKHVCFFEGKETLLYSIQGLAGVWDVLSPSAIPSRATHVRFSWLYGSLLEENNAIPFTGSFIIGVERDRIIEKVSVNNAFSKLSQRQHLMSSTRDSICTSSEDAYTSSSILETDSYLTTDGEVFSEGWGHSDFIDIPEHAESIICTLVGSQRESIIFYGEHKTAFYSIKGYPSNWNLTVPIMIPLGAKSIRANWIYGERKTNYNAVDFKLTFIISRKKQLYLEKANQAISESLVNKDILASYDEEILSLDGYGIGKAGAIVWGKQLRCSEWVMIPKAATHLSVTLPGAGSVQHIVYDKNKKIVLETIDFVESTYWGKKMLFSLPKERQWIRFTYSKKEYYQIDNVPDFKAEFIDASFRDNTLVDNPNIEVFDTSVLVKKGFMETPKGDVVAVNGNNCSNLIELRSTNIDYMDLPLPGSISRGLNCYDVNKNLLGTIFGKTSQWGTISRILPIQGTKYVVANWIDDLVGIKEESFVPFQITVVYRDNLSTFETADHPELKPVQAITKTTFSALGVPEHYLRIPFCEITQKGTMIVGADVREANAGDQTLISIGIVRSIDGGKTFEDAKIIIPHTDESEWDRAMDATILVDRKTNRIFVFCHRIPLKEYWEGAHQMGNYSFDMTYVYSDDDGLSWSQPKSLKSLFGENVITMFGGVGNGITMEDGTLVLPIQCKMATSTTGGSDGESESEMFNIQSGILYSKDGGETWTRSNLLPCYSSECNVVESQHGELIINARGYISLRRIFKTTDLGKTWTKMLSDKTLIEPGACQGSFHKVQFGDKAVGLFGNPKSKENRLNYTIQKTTDYNHFYPLVRLYKGYNYGYSCICSNNWGDAWVVLERVGSSIDVFDLSSIKPIMF